MKLTKAKLLNLALAFAVLFLLARRAPLWIENYQSEGQPAPAATVTMLNGKPQALPLPRAQLLVFWATWCGPCRIELARIQAMVDRGALDKEGILAISWGEEAAVVEAYARAKGYSFPIATDSTGEAARAYAVAATPTLVRVDASGKISWKTTGLSPSLEARLGE